MESSSGSDLDLETPAVADMFRRKLMQNALLHIAGRNIDPVDAARFQVFGLFEGSRSPSLPILLLDILSDRDHASWLPGVRGPLLFIAEDASVSVVEVAILLVDDNSALRRAGLKYCEDSASAIDPWLTPHTLSLMQNLSIDLMSDDASRWRPAGIEASDAIREDYFSHLGALRQSIEARFQEGINKNFPLVMRPGFNQLAHLRPPLWNPKEQRSEIQIRIAEFASLETLEDALSEYVRLYGQVPLRAECGIISVVRQWLIRNPQARVGWEQLRNWGSTFDSQSARYYAVHIALCVPSLRPPSSVANIWDEILGILGYEGEVELLRQAAVEWRVYCEIASHFARHVESLHPGQGGDPVACYAWWLSEKCLKIFAYDQELMTLLSRATEQESVLSYEKWSIARSPVVPTSLRNVTINMKSMWALALLADLRRIDLPLPSDFISEEKRAYIGSVLRGYLITSSIALQCREDGLMFTFQNDASIGDLGHWQAFIPAEKSDAFAGLMALRKRMVDASEFRSRLERILDLPPHEQHLLLLFLKEAVFSSSMYDEAVMEWLAQTDLVVMTLQSIPEGLLGMLLESLSEFQQHQRAQWVTRLPHTLAYAIETTDDRERVIILCTYMSYMSVNGNIVSPIQRVAASKWRTEFIKMLPHFRDEMVELVQHSELWVAARIRATSSEISRLIGPRKLAVKPEHGLYGDS